VAQQQSQGGQHEDEIGGDVDFHFGTAVNSRRYLCSRLPWRRVVAGSSTRQSKVRESRTITKEPPIFCRYHRFQGCIIHQPWKNLRIVNRGYNLKDRAAMAGYDQLIAGLLDRAEILRVRGGTA
jgi:hypothetical protein